MKTQDYFAIIHTTDKGLKGKGVGEVKEATSIAKNLRKKSEMKNQSRKIIKIY